MPKQTYVVIEEGMVKFTKEDYYPICLSPNGEPSLYLFLKQAKQLHADLGKVLDQIAEEKE